MSGDDRRIRQHLRQAAEVLLKTLETHATSGRLDKVEQLASKIQELARLRNFPDELRGTMKASSEITLSAYQQKIGDLLELAASLAAGADTQVRTAILDLIDTSLAKARMIGANPSFVDDVTRRVIRYRPQTSSANAPFESGHVFPAAVVSRADFAADTVPDSNWRARRYQKPLLGVMLLGVHYQTRNWSERGLVLSSFNEPVSLGARLHALITCDLVPDFDTKCWVRVTRYEATSKLLAVEFEKDSPIHLLVEQIATLALKT